MYNKKIRYDLIVEDKASKEIKKVEKGFEDLDKTVGKTNKSLASFDKVSGAMKVGLLAVSSAAAGAVLGLSKLTSESMKSLDALGKTSDKLGIATEKLASLHVQAELAGVSSNTLDTALQRMTRRLSEAAKGGGPAADAIKELGLNSQKLARMKPDEALREIAAAMGNVKNQSDKVRLAFKLFDSEGVNLINMLKGGTAAFDDAEKMAANLEALYQ